MNTTQVWPDSSIRQPCKNARAGFGRVCEVGYRTRSYIVIPLGPSTIRDGAGALLNFTVTPTNYITDDTTRYSLLALSIVQARANLLEAEKLISGDRYIFMRDAYLQRRDYLNKDGQVEDEFLDEDWEE
jgi:phospholipid-binding lipoprotein MlaA